MPGNNLSFKDKLQSRVATYLRCAGDVNNQIKKDLLLRLSVNFYLWNRWIFGKVTSKKCQGSGFLVRFVWLARTLLLHKSRTTRFHNHRRLLAITASLSHSFIFPRCHEFQRISLYLVRSSSASPPATAVICPTIQGASRRKLLCSGRYFKS